MEFAGFDWDAGNRAKYEKHGVSLETIEALFARPILILPDLVHSMTERRFKAIGRAENGRLVILVFTVRGDLIRPISARYMHKKEAGHHERTYKA